MLQMSVSNAKLPFVLHTGTHSVVCSTRYPYPSKHISRVIMVNLKSCRENDDALKLIKETPDECNVVTSVPQ